MSKLTCSWPLGAYLSEYLGMVKEHRRRVEEIFTFIKGKEDS